MEERGIETSKGLENPKFSRVKGQRDGERKMKGRKVEGNKEEKKIYIKKGMS